MQTHTLHAHRCMCRHADVSFEIQMCKNTRSHVDLHIQANVLTCIWQHVHVQERTFKSVCRYVLMNTQTSGRAQLPCNEEYICRFRYRSSRMLTWKK